MAVGDIKQPKTRSKGWTRVDEASERRWQQQAEKRRMLEVQQRQAMLAAMSPEERDMFLAGEKEAEDKRLAVAKERQIEYARQLHEQRQQLIAESQLIGGYVESEIASAIKRRPTYGLQEGDWLEDPVACVTGQYGFAEEKAVSTGIKLQIHICLDISNSMYHNGLHNVAVDAARNLYLALDTASKTLPGNSLQVHLWTWAGGEDGKGVDHLSTTKHRLWDINNPLGCTANLPDGSYSWTGEDTWLYPLLEKLYEWEQQNGDHGAYRLDLIISDGVLDHATDARKGDKIQDDRDGRLQSIVLNFLPFSEWCDYRVPNRCIQYPVDANNLMPMMRQVLGEWLVGI